MLRKSLLDLAPADIGGRRVLIRVDYNVPLADDGTVRDANRIRATLPTLEYVIGRAGRPVLLSHLGRPKGHVVPGLSLAPVAPVLESLLGRPVLFVASTDSPEALQASEDLPADTVLLLENTRFLPGETKNDPELSARLARLGDVFVNDAFGSTHRSHCSTVGVTEHLRPAVAGLLVQRELEALGALREADRTPFTVLLGGAKIGDKIGLLETFLERADSLLIGGAMANTFLAAAGGSTGRSLVEREATSVAQRFLGSGSDKLHLPIDLVVADPDARDASDARVVPAMEVPDGLSALDIGPETRDAFGDVVRGSGTVFWNGPMGLFERPGFDVGTAAVARAAAACTSEGGFTVV